jgi:hypothetical protein
LVARCHQGLVIEALAVVVASAALAATTLVARMSGNASLCATRRDLLFASWRLMSCLP